MTALDQMWLEGVAAGWVQWRPGMAYWLDGLPGRLVGRDPSASLLAFGLPIWDDPATLGILLGQAREAWGCPDLTTSAGGNRDRSISWELESIRPMGLGGIREPTEAGALLAVLRAGPRAFIPGADIDVALHMPRGPVVLTGRIVWDPPQE